MVLSVPTSPAVRNDAGVFQSGIRHMHVLIYVCLPRAPSRVCPTRNKSKVGSRFASSLSSLKADVSKRLRITAESTEAPLSAAEGILAGLNKNGSMLASVGTREGMEDVLAIIAPLMAAIEMGKKMVRCECVFVSFRRIRPMCDACL